MNSMNENVKILVACHKPDVYPTDDLYLPVHVGKALSELDLGIQTDNEGVNISAKNPYYCELTAIYWAWKNLKNVDIIGLCHYRRYFDFHNQCDKVFPDTVFSTSDFNNIDLTIPQSVIDSIHNGVVYNAIPTFNYRLGINESNLAWVGFNNADKHFRKCMMSKIHIPNFILSRIVDALFNRNEIGFRRSWGNEKVDKEISKRDQFVLKLATYYAQRIKPYRIKF